MLLRIRILVVCLLLLAILRLVGIVHEVSATASSIGGRTLKLSSNIVIGRLRVLVLKDWLWESRGGCWKDTLVRRLVIAIIVVSSPIEIQMRTTVGIHSDGGGTHNSENGY